MTRLKINNLTSCSISYEREEGQEYYIIIDPIVGNNGEVINYSLSSDDGGFSTEVKSLAELHDIANSIMDYVEHAQKAHNK